MIKSPTISFSKKKWDFLKVDEDLVNIIRNQTNLSDLVIKILINRGFKTSDEINSFINTKLKNTIPDPSLFLDIDKAVSRLTYAILNNQKIFIFGDYDVDGITSTYLIVKYLQNIGINAQYYIPNRFTDGYGLSEKSINKTISQNNIDLLITVDCGINSIKEIDIANKNKIDTIILDHHIQISDFLPDAIAVVNPNRKDQKEIGCSYIKDLCAAGLVFIFLIALQRNLKNINFFKSDFKEQNLLDFIDIVALGTLCDVMQLKGINRAIIKYLLNNHNNIKYSDGISSLMELFNIKEINSPEDLSFFIGPAINAAGRLGMQDASINLLLEKNPEKSQKIANELLKFNKKRKDIEKDMLNESMIMIHQNDLSKNNGICVFSDNWNEGIIGIIAGRIKDKFNKPSFVISFNKDGIGKGSSRSLTPIHLGELFEKMKNLDIIIDGGGHALAGGFSIHKNKIDEFIDFINTNIPNSIENTVMIDYIISHKTNLDQISEELSIIEPFGKGIEKPIFCIKRVRIKNIRKTNSGGHLMLILGGEMLDGNMKSIIFNYTSKSEFIKPIEENKDELFDIIGTISPNKQFGSSFIIEDIRFSI